MSLSRTIKLFFLSLFLLTPVIFTSINSELFELPKMYFVYGIATIIFTLHLINYLRGRTTLVRLSFLDSIFILFYSSQLISTIFSIDVYTSVFGYYSRLNGGLLSLTCYFLLYFVIKNYLDNQFKNNIILASLISGFLIATFGIAEHFGIDKSVWVQDVQARVFSTLGQPNWLAAYLCILLPFAVDKTLKSKKFSLVISNLSLVIIFYTCLLFTKSKTGIIAAILSLGFYFVFSFFQKNISKKFLIINYSLLTILSLLISNPLKDFLVPPPSRGNAPEGQGGLNITPSEDIRKIVWQGTYQLWQQFPVFGTGPETFAYSYYWTRPASHNLTSEWDFLYNKAHNEYLNYLATTGAFGFLSYIVLILFTIYFLRQDLVILAAFLSILITNFSGFSVVITSLYFFILPTFSIDYSSKKINKPKSIFLIFPVILISLFLLSKILFYYLADITYAQADSDDTAQKYQSASQNIALSLGYRPNEPLYLIKSANLASKLALVAHQQKNDDLANKYAQKAIQQSNLAIRLSPFSTNDLKERAQIYYYLSSIDSQYYADAIKSLIQETRLAPTDAKTFYLIGQFYQDAKATDSAINYYQQAINLKSNYDYAYFALGKIYFDQKKYDLAKTNFEQTLKYAPTNTDAQNYLAKIAKP